MAGVMYLDDLPDPEGRYDGLVKAFSLTGVTVNTPDVRDHDGRLIAPGEYSTKIKDGAIVEVEVRPKFFLLLMIEPPFQVDHQAKTIHSIKHERLGWVSCLPTSRPTEDETDAYIIWLVMETVKGRSLMKNKSRPPILHTRKHQLVQSARSST